MEAAVGLHRSVFSPSAGVVQPLFGGSDSLLLRTTPPSSVRSPLGFGTAQSKSKPKYFQCRAGEGSLGSDGSGVQQYGAPEFQNVSDGEPRLGSCVESNGGANEQLEGSERNERFATTASIPAPESPLGEELNEASFYSSDTCPDPLGHQISNSQLDFNPQNPTSDLREASRDADVTSDFPIRLDGASASQDEALERRPSKPVVYIVDIMPICYRGRGRGKLDPKACLEWMEALIGIAGDSPIIGVGLTNQLGCRFFGCPPKTAVKVAFNSLLS